MPRSLAQSGVVLDLSQAQSLAPSQRWVLTAMAQHGPQLLAMLWRILGNEQDVCDAYQDTFLKLAHYQQGLLASGTSAADAQPKNIKAYLFRSAGNVAISMLRKKTCRLNAQHDLADIRPQSHHPDYADQLDLKHTQQLLRHHILALPEHLRNAIILRDLAELPYAQVARSLGISVATARVYRCRAVRLLAARMADKKES